MRSRWLTILLTTVACGCSTSTSTVPPDEETRSTASSSQETQEPVATTSQPPPAEAAPKRCEPLNSEAAFARWREQLMAEVNTEELEAAKVTLQCVDPGFAHTLLSQPAMWLVDATPHHLDHDRDEEWVLLFRQRGHEVTEGEREELVWFAVYDLQDGDYSLAGVQSWGGVTVCVEGEEDGIAIEVGEHVAGPDAGLVVTAPVEKSCSSPKNAKTTRTRYRVEGGRLVGTPFRE